MKLEPSREAFTRWSNFPMCTVDGTLILILAPKENEYVCRKGFHSLNIQVVVDHERRYIMYLFQLSATHLSILNM